MSDSFGAVVVSIWEARWQTQSANPARSQIGRTSEEAWLDPTARTVSSVLSYARRRRPVWITEGAAGGNSRTAFSFKLNGTGVIIMPRGEKSKYTDKQERKADHIAEGYEKRGVPEQEAERRAWATVNKDDGGGKNPGGSGRGKSTGHPAAHKGGEKGGTASASRSASSRSASAKKAAATRKRNAEQHA
jgi:plasmid stabilization system protein ParE